MKGTCITLINQNKASCQLWVLSFYASNILKLRKWDIKRLKQRYGDKWNASAFASLHTPLYSYIITYICIIFCIPDSYLPFLLISTNLTASVNLTWSTEIDFVNFATLWWTELMLTPIDWLHPLPFFQILFNPSFFMTLSCFLDLSIPKNDIYHKDNSLAYKAIWAISSMLTCLATIPL